MSLLDGICYDITRLSMLGITIEQEALKQDIIYPTNLSNDMTISCGGDNVKFQSLPIPVTSSFSIGVS